MHSTHNEGKSDVAERFIRRFLKICKYMTSISKNVYIDKLNDIVNFGKEVNDKDVKFKVGDHVGISKYKTFLLKDILQISLKRFL